MSSGLAYVCIAIPSLVCLALIARKAPMLEPVYMYYHGGPIDGYSYKDEWQRGVDRLRVNDVVPSENHRNVEYLYGIRSKADVRDFGDWVECHLYYQRYVTRECEPLSDQWPAVEM